jgi:hypothetical protein
MDLRCTQQDGSWLKVQELAAYVSPAKWHESQSNIPSNGVQSAVGTAAAVKRITCFYVISLQLSGNYLNWRADHR